MEVAAVQQRGLASTSLKVIGSDSLLTELPKNFSKWELAYTGFSPTGLFS